MNVLTKPPSKKVAQENPVGAMIRSPYIGVTAFMERREVEFALDFMPANSDRKLMVGVLASSTTLSGEENKLPGRFPKVSDIGNIFIEHPLAFNVVHYATRDRDTIDSQLRQVVGLAPNLIQGIQLNMVWPNPHLIRAFRMSHPNTKLILQVGPRAFNAVDRKPDELVQKLREYRRIIDYVLLDDSGGYGKEMDALFLRPFARQITKALPDLQIVIAGGLHKGNLHIIMPIVEELPSVSIDAEGKLRDDTKDRLDMKEVSSYIISSSEFFTKI